jgi:hypothetical protein
VVLIPPVMGPSWTVSVIFGEKEDKKAGGVELDAKKTPFERDPFELLQRLQQATIFSNEIGSPPALILTT